MLKFNVEQIFTRCSFGKVDPQFSGPFFAGISMICSRYTQQIFNENRKFQLLITGSLSLSPPHQPPLSILSFSLCVSTRQFSPSLHIFIHFSFCARYRSGLLIVCRQFWCFHRVHTHTQTQTQTHIKAPRRIHTYTHTGKKAPVKLNQTFFNSHFEFQCFFDVYFGFYVSLCRSHEMLYT